MRRLLFVAVMSMLLALLFLPVPAFAENSAPETATTLNAEYAGEGGRLVGNSGGAGRFYRIEYAGNGQPVTIKVSSLPSQDVTGPRFGFKVYGPAGFVGEAIVEHHELSYTRYTFTVASVTPGSYQIQIYNFADGLAVDYYIETTGLSAATSSTSGNRMVAVATTPENAVLIPQTNSVEAGALLGKDHGSFQYFAVEYPGMNTLLDLRMTYSPPSPLQNGAVGFNVYSGDGKLLCQSSESSRDSSTANVVCSVQTEVPDTMTVQVLNYEPGFSANYTLRASGASGPITDVADIGSPERAFVLTAQMPAARGTLPAGPEGTYNYFVLNHPGGNKVVNVGIVVDQVNGYYDRTIGFSVYQGSDGFGTYDAHVNDLGTKRIASVPLNQSNATTFGIQVFNWTRGLPVTYKIYVTGLAQ